jgi:glycogen debranching enzyme
MGFAIFFAAIAIGCFSELFHQVRKNPTGMGGFAWAGTILVGALVLAAAGSGFYSWMF